MSLFVLIEILTILIFGFYKLLTFKRVRTSDGRKLEDTICTIPGKWSWIGNSFDFLKLTPETLFNYVRHCHQYAKGKSYLLHFVGNPVYNVSTAEDAVELFRSTTLIHKSVLYNLVEPFLGKGLLNSGGKKYHYRRKMITPTFHLNILQNFLGIFKEQSLKLVENLETLQNEDIDLYDITQEFTLNNVIETALGVKMDDMSGGTAYRKKLHNVDNTVRERILNVFMVFDIVYQRTENYKRQRRDLKIIHDFTNKIIEKKRAEYRNREMEPLENENDIGSKKRKTILDTLLEEEAKGNIDHKGILDEVNTIMLGGFDTTSICLTFAMLNLALNPDIQEKCREEIDQLDDFSSMGISDLNKLQYLDCVIKETLRLYPSLPFIGRVCAAETQLNGLILPKFTEIFIHVYDIMRDPNHYPDPNTFKPERFLPENANNRHPFAFVPFSGGVRSCVGQKFAYLEMKTVLAAILRNFQILPVTKLEDIRFEIGMVLRTKENIYVKLNKI